MSPVEDSRPVGPRAGRDEEPRPPVVVGVDGSDSARHAAEWAADVASAWGAPVHLVHAVPDGVGAGASGPSWLHELHDAVERAGVEEVESVVLAVSATEALTARSRGAGLVVVGSYGEGARSGMLAGSAALALLEASQCPVAVVRGAVPGLAPPRRGPVVVGTDAVTDDDALHLGAALAVGLGARLSVLHAWSDIVADAQSVHRTTSSGTELAALAVARLDTCLRPLREAHPELPIERHVVDDTALRAPLDHASGHRPRHSARAGTDGPRRAPTAPAPVTVVIGAPGRPPAADLRAGQAVETVRLTATALGLDLHVRAAPATTTTAIERRIGRTTDTLAVVQIGRPGRGENRNCDLSDRRAT